MSSIALVEPIFLPPATARILSHDTNGTSLITEKAQAPDYGYDANGNMIRDDNKGIKTITYNHLNLPTKITFVNPNNITYLYNAVGQKLGKVVTENVVFQTVVVKTDYLSGFQYVNDVMQFFPHAEGYVKVTGTSYDYVYNYTDHLGNIRLSYSKESATNALKVIEENHYYPFGLKHTGYNSDKYYIAPSPVIKWPNKGDYVDTIILPFNPADFSLSLNYDYRYNSKEFQDELGLNQYDYGARNYDPALGRWMNMDPLAEMSRRWSPYNYAYNNPVYFIDPDGMLSQSFIDDLWNKSGNDTTWTNNNDGTFSGSNGESADTGEGGGDDDKKKKKGKKEDTKKAEYNNSSLKYATASSAVLVADDATVVGVVDDVLLPVVWSVAAGTWVYDNRVLLAKQAIELKKLLEKTMKPSGFTYELRINRTGEYVDVRGNVVHLNAGDVWKYGETSSGMSRYSQSTLNSMVPGGVSMVPIFFGNQVETKVQEKIMIYGYTLMNGSLPPGNKIFR